MGRLVSLTVLLLLFIANAQAQEKLRVPRPQPDRAIIMRQAVFTAKRTPMQSGAFEQWRRNYCSPSVCNMVLCHGACADFVEHCPSFSESAQIVKSVRGGCMATPVDSVDKQTSQMEPAVEKGQSTVGCCR